MIVTLVLDTTSERDRETLKAFFGDQGRSVTISPVLAAPYNMGAKQGLVETSGNIAPFPPQDNSAQIFAGVAKLAPAPVAETAKPSSPFSDEDVANATRDLASTLGQPGILRATELLNGFGVQRARDLPIEKREDYITAAKKIVTEYKATNPSKTA